MLLALTAIKIMKKSFLFLFLLLITFLIYVVINSDTKKYAVNEANKICSWLNSDKAEITFRVGPNAFYHLQNFKKIDQEYTCKASSSEHMHGYKDEIAVVVSANGKDQIMLIYGLGVSGRHFYQPRYFQHWTGNKVRHHE
ncbi:MAG: hypothetical protein JXR16_06785 [Bermanella sp.]